MAGTLSERPSHYDALGLTPAANDDQIARAFATRMKAFRWHPAGAAAELWIAYEMLRDRIKRADYDRSLGIVPQRPKSWSMAVTQQQWTSFIATEEREIESPAAALPQPELHVRSDPPIDARLEAIAATIRELAKPADPLHAARAPDREPVQPRRQPNAELDIVIEDIRRVGRLEKERLQSEVRPLNWKRPLQLAGGLVVGAGLPGVLLGMSTRDNSTPAEAQVPPAHIAAAPLAASVDGSLVTAPHAAASKDADLYLAKPHSYRGRAASHSAQPADRPQMAENAVVENQPDVTAGDQLAADPLAPKPADAALPLSKSTIARTIDRIGYRCGEVASATAVDGAPGTFSVTCSSGQTYRATPVHGRYRFRRSGGG